MGRIEKIAPDGNTMKSFSDNAEHSSLTFLTNDQQETIGFFQERFKTPSTSFNSSESEVEDERYEDIDGLLFPDLTKNIVRIKTSS